MKKILFLIFLSMILVLPVSAKENKLYFTGNKDHLYYKPDLYDENVFLKHLDMIPGKLYEDELIIENHTKYDYKLYLMVKRKEQSSLAEELLKNIEIEIYVDDTLLYTCYANGLDYRDTGIDLANAIYIGEYKAGNDGKLVTKTKLNEGYSNINNEELASIEWQFFAEYDELAIPINPETGENVDKSLKIVMISLFMCFSIFLFYIFVIEKKRIKIKRL